MASNSYLFFESRYKKIKQLKDNAKIEITLVFYEAIEATCILKQYKNRDLSDVCQALMSIRHPNIAVVYDYVYEDGNTYALEELVVGRTLSELLEENGTFSETETRRIIIDICNGLEKFHSQKPPIVHNDIKTSNIMIRDDGCVKLIDFDISRTYKVGADKNTHLYGTKEYASPEHFGFGQSEPRSDIYSLGVTMHEMLTGKNLDSEHNITYKGKLSKIIKKCVKVDRKKRYFSVTQLKKDLEKNKRIIRKILWIILVAYLVGVFFAIGFGSFLQNDETVNSDESLSGTNVTQNQDLADDSKQSDEDRTQSNEVEQTEENTNISKVENLKMKSSAKTEGNIESIVVYHGKEITLEDIQGTYYIKSENIQKELSNVNAYYGCKLAYDSYKDCLYLFGKVADMMVVYSVSDNLELSELASFDYYSANSISDTSTSFYSDGMMISQIFRGDLVDSNNWTKVGKRDGGQYVINDKLYEIITQDLKLKCFAEVDMQGNIIKEYQSEVSFLETDATYMNVYIDGSAAYFIVTIKNKEYLYRFDGTQYEEVICLNDYQYYSSFGYNHLVVNGKLVICYDETAKVIKKFEIK